MTPHITPDGRVSMKTRSEERLAGRDQRDRAARHQQEEGDDGSPDRRRRDDGHRRDPPDLADREPERSAVAFEDTDPRVPLPEGHEHGEQPRAADLHHAEDPEGGADPGEGPLTGAAVKRIKGTRAHDPGALFHFRRRGKEIATTDIPHRRRDPRARACRDRRGAAGRARDPRGRHRSGAEAAAGRPRTRRTGCRSRRTGSRSSRASGSGRRWAAPSRLLLRNLDWENWREKMAQDGDGAGVEPLETVRPGHADLAGGAEVRSPRRAQRPGARERPGNGGQGDGGRGGEAAAPGAWGGRRRAT